MSVKNCQNCNSEFEITTQDQEFYEKLKVNEPTFCPTCRRQRKLAFRNERHLYNRKCDLCKKEIISVFPEGSQYMVYCHECWWSDKWDPISYGRDYDFSKHFFEQFSDMEKSIPHFALFQEGMSENCKYVNYGIGNKSCYLALCANCEDLYYSHGGYYSKSCMDCTKIIACELCYECIDCNKCYQLFFAQDCNNCNSSHFLKDCISCSNCFCCCGLRNKQFCFENKQLSEAEYKKRISEIKFTISEIEKYKKNLEGINLKIPKKFFHGINNQNSTGDYLDNCKNAENCFDCIDVENVKNCDLTAVKTHNVYDCMYAGEGCESCYEINGAVGFNNCKFVYYGRFLKDCEYCQICFNSGNLFGCFGLNRKQFCILNKQFSEEEYLQLREKIINHMKSTNEYGEFFPVANSSFAYNESVASEHYPLTKEEVLEKGYKWFEQENKISENEAVSCRQCSKSYKIISQELDFYKKFNLPIPEFCHNCRHKLRFNKRNLRQLWLRQCQKCNIKLKTSYSPNRPELIYCEKCYLETIV